MSINGHRSGHSKLMAGLRLSEAGTLLLMCSIYSSAFHHCE